MSICFYFQAPPAPHKWPFMEYLKLLIFCALLAIYLLRAVYSAIVYDTFMHGEGTELPVGQTDADGVGKAVSPGRGAVGVMLVCQMGTSPAGSSSGVLRPPHSRGTLHLQTLRGLQTLAGAEYSAVACVRGSPALCCDVPGS